MPELNEKLDESGMRLEIGRWVWPWWPTFGIFLMALVPLRSRPYRRGCGRAWGRRRGRL